MKRIGYAVGDTETGIAFGREIIENDKNVYKNIQRVCDEEKIEYIVIGLPVSLEEEGDELEYAVRTFGDIVADVVNLPIVYEDERLSSKLSKAILREQEVKAKDQKGKVDVLAAQRILQQWMDRGSGAEGADPSTSSGPDGGAGERRERLI